jgi:tetratricopeptide (TPR) repeat protein
MAKGWPAIFDRMLMRVSLITGLIFYSLITGCSSHIKPKDSEVLSKEEATKKALENVSASLERFIEQSKDNKDSVRLISGDLFLKANMSLLEGDYLTASALFKHVASLEPEDAFVQKKYAVSLIRLGDLEQAKVVLEKLYGQTKEEKVGMILAGVYSGLDKDQKSKDLYQKLLVQNPKNEDACVFLGKSLALEKKMTQAISKLKGCAAHNKESGVYHYYLGKLSVDEGKLSQAQSFFEQSLKRQPGLSQSASALGLILEEKGQYKTAVKVYQNYLSSYPNDSQILNRMVQVLFATERYQEVIPFAERLCDLEPENLNLKVKLGVLYTDAKKYAQAVSIFKDLLAAAPESDKILYYLGAIYQEMQEYQLAIEYFNQIPSSSGLYADSSIQMANMLSTMAQNEFADGDEKKWQSKFLTFVSSKYEELKEMRIELSVIKAGFYEGVSQFKTAMEIMMVVQDEKGFSNNHKFYLASLYEREKKFEESVRLIKSIIEIEPKNAHAWNFLGYSLLNRGIETEKAFEYIQKAHVMNPQDGYIRDSLGWYYYKKGQMKKALGHLQAAYAKVPDDVEILKHLATIYSELGDYQKARVYLESALKFAKMPSEKQSLSLSLEKLDSTRLPASDK